MVTPKTDTQGNERQENKNYKKKISVYIFHEDDKITPTAILMTGYNCYYDCNY